MKKNSRLVVFSISLLVIILLSMSSVVQAKQNKKYSFLATDGDINPENDYHHYIDYWSGNGLEERIVTLEWYTYSEGDIVTVESQGWNIRGIKANFKVYENGNDIFLYMKIYKSASSKMSETILWQVINGSDSTNDRITSVLMSIETERVSNVITLYAGQEETVIIPFSYTYSCRMWLM